MFKTLFFKCCYYLGFYPTKIRSPQSLYAYLKRQPMAIKEYELTRVSYAVAFAKDHDYYRALLQLFVPEWPVKHIEKPKFIGEGYGGSSLDAYRQVRIRGEAYFEKVYFRSSRDLEKLQWLQANVADIVREKINFPAIQKIYPGELLSIVYFEFLELDQSRLVSETDLIRITKELYQLSRKYASQLGELKQPESINDFNLHHQYAKYKEIAGKELDMGGLNRSLFEKWAKKSKCVLTHGDIQKTNLYQNSTLLDWDSFGIYPIGLDPAFLFFRLLFKEGVKTYPVNWLRENYQSFIAENDWKDFERNFIYFLFVFCMEIFFEDKMEEIKMRLLHLLKGYP